MRDKLNGYSRLAAAAIVGALITLAISGLTLGQSVRVNEAEISHNSEQIVVLRAEISKGFSELRAEIREIRK